MYEKGPQLKWPSLDELFGWGPEKPEELLEEMQIGPLRQREIVLSYIQRPGEAVKAGIKAKIEKEPILPAISGGLKGEIETPGRDILSALNIPIDDPEWLLDHPVQHFFYELGGAGLEVVTDPVIWALWFAPGLVKGAKGLKSVQKFMGKRQITSFAKTLRSDLTEAGVDLMKMEPEIRSSLLKGIIQSPKYSRYTSSPWYQQFIWSMEQAEKAGKAAKPMRLSYAFSVGLPKEMGAQAINNIAKFAPLVAKAGGSIPELGTTAYRQYWGSLSKTQQELELARKKAIETGKIEIEVEPPEFTLAIRDKTGKIYKATRDEKIHTDMMPRLKLKPEDMELGWVDSKGTFFPSTEGITRLGRFELAPETFSKELKLRQNADIEERIMIIGATPSAQNQDLYLYNLTGEKPVTDATQRTAAFEKALKENNPTAYEALKTGEPKIGLEELSVKMTNLDKEIANINKLADEEFEGATEFLGAQLAIPEEESFMARVKGKGGIKYSSAVKDYGNWQRYPLMVKHKEGLPFDEMADELGISTDELDERLMTYRARPSGEDFEEEAYELIDTNQESFPNFIKRQELLDERDRVQDGLLALRAKMSPSEKGAKIDAPEVTIEPSGKFGPEMKPSEMPLAKGDTPEEQAIIDEQDRTLLERARAEETKIRHTEQWGFKSEYIVQDEVTPPSGIKPPKDPKQLFISTIPPEDISTTVEPWPNPRKDVGALGWIRRFDYLASDYERASGIPFYSEGTQPITEASQMMRREEIGLLGTLSQIMRDTPLERRVAIGKFMEGKEIKLSEDEVMVAKNMQNLYKFLGKEFGIEPERMIQDYLPRIMAAMREGDPSKVPAEMQAWFKRSRVGELKWKLEDPLEITRIYIHAGLRDKYLYDSRLIPDFVKHIQDLPFGIKRKASHWLAHKILRHPTPLDREIAVSFEKIPGWKKRCDKWGVDSTVANRQLTRAIAQCTYGGGIGFRVISATKNVTQQTHNIAILGPEYWLKGIINAPKQDERELIESLNVLRKYGAELERRGVDNPASIPQRVIDASNFLFRCVDSGSRRVCLSGSRKLVHDKYKLLQDGKIDRGQFLKKTKFDLLPFGARPKALELFRDGDIEGYANHLGKELVKLGQYTYEAEDMPLAFAGNMGRLSSIFLSWPIEFAEMQAHFIKTGHWERILYYYVAATLVQNGLREAGIETNPYGYGDIEIGDHRISLIPGGWFLFGSVPTSFTPVLQVIYSGGRVAGVYLKGASDRYLNEVKNEFLRSTQVLAPFRIAEADIAQAITEIISGKYGKRDKNGRLIYISDLSEVILRGLGFTTPTEAEETGRYREPIYKQEPSRQELGTLPWWGAGSPY